MFHQEKRSHQAGLCMNHDWNASILRMIEIVSLQLRRKMWTLSSCQGRDLRRRNCPRTNNFWISWQLPPGYFRTISSYYANSEIFDWKERAPYANKGIKITNLFFTKRVGLGRQNPNKETGETMFKWGPVLSLMLQSFIFMTRVL